MLLSPGESSLVGVPFLGNRKVSVEVWDISVVREVSQVSLGVSV